MIQLGADVNVGSGLESPLCLACKYQDIRLISLLLQENVHDLLCALKLALGLRNDNIIGQILYDYGHDRDGSTFILDIRLDNFIPA